MSRISRIGGGAAVVLALALTGAPTPPVLAADNVPGKVYEDTLVGYRFRPLNEWGRIPQGTDPDDPKVAGFYSEKAKFEFRIKPECEVFAFRLNPEEDLYKSSRRDVATGPTVPEPPSGGGGEGGGEGGMPTEAEIRRMMRSARQASDLDSLLESIKDRYKDDVEQLWNAMSRKDQAKNREKAWRWDVKEKEVKTADDVPLRILQIDTVCEISRGPESDILPMQFILGVIRSDDYEIVAMYQLPEYCVKQYAAGAAASVRSLELLDQSEVLSARTDLGDALVGKTDDEKWLAMIKRKVTEGWAHMQTKNYLIIYDKVVKPDRVKLVAQQIEAIRRDIYEVLFPPDRPLTAISVVRVCKDKNQYHQYGGPPSSAGYWASFEQELVFYEDTSAKKDALRVLNHEAFHQYIFYSVGSISPHSWFNEGHGDYFSGHNYSPASKRFVPKPFAWRTGTVKNIIGSKQYVPLEEFVKYSQQEYYARGQENYSQGWSFIWFLRQQKNPAWKDILPTYFNTLKTEVTNYIHEQTEAMKAAGTWKEGDKVDVPPSFEDKAREAALKAAFGDFDKARWERLEAEWKKFM